MKNLRNAFPRGSGQFSSSSIDPPFPIALPCEKMAKRPSFTSEKPFSPHSAKRSWLFSLALLVPLAWMIITVFNKTAASDDDEYYVVDSRIAELEIKRVAAVEHSEDTKQIDNELAQLRPRLEKLRQSHVATAMKRAAEEGQRAADEAEKRKMKQYEEEHAAFQKRCEATRSKRITDLTVKDLDLLKSCGTSIPGLPQVR